MEDSETRFAFTVAADKSPSHRAMFQCDIKGWLKICYILVNGGLQHLE
jgi:hypothetical protein